MSYLSLFESKNYSLLSIPGMWLLTFAPAFMKSMLVQKTIGIDNVNFRQNINRLSEKKVKPEIIARANNLVGAHTNNLETFPLWTAAIIVANYAKLDNKTLNVGAAVFLATRYLYNVIYINQKTQAQAGLRSLVWMSSLVPPFYLLVTAALKIADESA